MNDLAYVAGYLGDESRLYVVDMRDPTAPVPVGYYTSVGQRYALWAEGNLAYLATSNVNLRLTEERWPKLTFHATREHAVKLA